jgi:Rrf2 family protein
MISLSQTSAYAVHALSCLRHTPGGTCMTKHIAESTGIPRPYLARIINKLNHAGLIRAKRGHQGGVALTRPAEEISILEVVEAVEGQSWIAACPLGLEGCTSQGSCPTHKAWQKLSTELRKFLRVTTLADTVPFILQSRGTRNQAADCSSQTNRVPRNGSSKALAACRKPRDLACHHSYGETIR